MCGLRYYAYISEKYENVYIFHMHIKGLNNFLIHIFKN